MSHDFAKNKKSKKRNGPQARKVNNGHATPGWVFFMLGVCCTLAVQFAWHTFTDSPQLSQKLQQAKQTISQEKPAEKPARPDITFYKTLPEMNVDVDVESVADRGQKIYNRALQAGAFKTESDANQQRAEIMLLGLDATIEPHTNADGTTWYRVIVGPFNSRSDLNKARNKLVSQNMQTLVIRRD